ncbi:MAG: phenylacetate-CoA oxygenase subunit PaaJ, partial [Flavobacteriia bacterium]|nr:phenylacetate-CoA oxygenase subunit PaaJ [Flavobacteriia bacterium]
MVTEKRVWEILDQVSDPEIPVLTIADLGIIRSISAQGEGFKIVITPTYSGCPAMRVIESEIEFALAKEGITDVTIETVLSPAWTTDWITQEAKDKLRAYGIAPPHSGADHDCLTQGNTSIVQFAARSASNPGRHELMAVPCPQCG